MKIRIILLALFCTTIAHAQSVIDQVFKTIVPETERAFYNFQSVDGQTKILGYGNGISNVYDEKWNTLEFHNAGQEELNTGYYYLTRSYQYDSNRKTLSNRREIARYDANGVKLNSPQKGVNIILYSDGTSNKVIEK